jgi:hypothetical protein
MGAWHEVTDLMSRRVNEYCEVSFTSWGTRTLEITPNHTVYAASFDDIPRVASVNSVPHPDKGWKRRHRGDLHKYLKWIPVSELTPYHYMCVPITTEQRYSVGVNKARLYGYYIAEGNFGTNYTTITCNANDVFVDEIKQLANWTSVSIRRHRNSDKCVVIDCFGKHVKDDIEKNCGRCCKGKHIPEVIRFGSVEDKYNFVAAWFNGDGWQDNNGLHWSISQANLATDLQLLLASLGIVSSCTKINHPEHRGIISSKDAVEYVVNISNEYSDRFEDISKAKAIAIEGTTKCRTFISGNYLMVPIKEVKYISKPTKVYNFSVDTDESYTTYGLAVHNCKVAYDRCSICNNIRKQAGEKTECSHVRDELGKTYDDGRQVGTYNDEPDFFDISFVGRPADRIAWDLVTHKVDEPLDKETGKIHKTASAKYDYSTAAALGLDSVKYAEYEGVRAPDELAISSASGLRKLGYIRDLASYHNSYRGWLSKQAAVVSAKDKYLYELRKIASARLDDNTISQLREYDPKVTFAALGEAGVMLDVPSFFKYAMGPDYNVVAPYVSEIEKAVPEVIDQAVKQANCQDLCNNTTYDAAPNAYVKQVKPELRKKLAEASMTLDTENTLLFNTISGNTPNFVVDYSGKKCLNNSVVTKLAEKYASYKLSAIDAVIQSNTNNQNNRTGFGGIKQAQASSLSTDEITAIAAAQNLKYS